VDLALIRNLAGGAAAVVSLPGTIELGLLTLASMLPGRAARRTAVNPVRLAVVIPAHNERENLGQCLDSLLADNRDKSAVITVIADNCTDETAEIARRKGVDVIERFNTTLRGKGYALEYAFDLLAPRRFDAYIIVDADSVVPRGFFAAFAAAFSNGADAVQCPYLALHADASNRTQLLDIALRGFNWIRPLGRERLGLSVGILGNGFGLRRELLERVPYTAHSVVEDLEYHLALVDHGYRVQLVENTQVQGEMPGAGKGRETQRARWEGGRVRMLREHTLPLLGKVLSGRGAAVEPLFELLLFPLGFHVVLLLAGLVAASDSIRAVAGFGLAMVLLHVVAAVGRGGSVGRDLKALITAPGYVLWKIGKLPMILLASRKNTGWVRTERAATQEEKR
jgi:cellulose synthase/poly-beta-1,6-N-acetylglucosamine synthase-like glycosyltransferase